MILLYNYQVPCIKPETSGVPGGPVGPGYMDVNNQIEGLIRSKMLHVNMSVMILILYDWKEILSRKRELFFLK